MLPSFRYEIESAAAGPAATSDRAAASPTIMRVLIWGAPSGSIGGSRRRDVVVGLEHILRVVVRLDPAQALPRIRVEERARVAGFLDEVRVQAGAAGRHGGKNRVNMRLHVGVGARLRHDAQREDAEFAGEG